MVDFSLCVVGFNDGEIIFVYENFNGEMGVCCGVEFSNFEKGFFVSCIDFVGCDCNNQFYLELWLCLLSVDQGRLCVVWKVKEKNYNIYESKYVIVCI